jgi:hypothetical protein
MAAHGFLLRRRWELQRSLPRRSKAAAAAGVESFFQRKVCESGVWIGKQASAHNAPLRRMADYSRMLVHRY